MLRDQETFSSDSHNATGLIAQLQARAEAETGGPAARTVLGADPPAHTRLRSLVSKAFTPRRVASLRPHIEEVTRSLLDAAPAAAPFDVVTGLAQPLPIIIIAEMLGIPPENRGQFKEWSSAIAQGTAFMRTPEITAQVTQARGELRTYFREIIAARRAHPGADLITALVEARDEGDALSEEELLGFCSLLLVAGNETTTHLISHGTLALARHPEQAALLRARPDLWPSAVEELLRFDGPVQATVRHALAEVEVGGTRIAKGESLLVLLAAANRDPAQFTAPDVLDVRRQDNQHLAMGVGIHYCLGAPLARLEAEVALSALLQRQATLRLAEEEPEYGGTFILRGLRRLVLTPPAEAGRGAGRRSPPGGRPGRRPAS